nr:gliding motility-associated C-terminal domain-containing protein [Saprospiraceae bacterium]
MKIFYNLSLFVLCSVYWCSIGYSNSIEGPQNVCFEECYEYTIDLPGGEITALNWVLSNQDGTISLDYQSDGNTLLLCFPLMAGLYELTAFDDEGNQYGPLEIFVGEFTEIELRITTPLSCYDQSPGQQSCFEVCEGALVTFEVLNLRPTEMQWNFSGAGVIVSQNLNSITIQFEEGPGSGSIGFFGKLGESCVFEGGACIRIFEKPEAGFDSQPEAEADTITICRNQSVRFTNTSSADNIQWFSDNGKSTEGNTFRVEFQESGYYTVTQRVEETCDCEDFKSVVVHVIDEPGPVIYCTASVCQGDTATYRTDANCEPYFWSIEGMGTVIEGGSESDNYIDVIWEGGIQGTVSLSNGCSENCPNPTAEVIYILGDDTQIEGPVDICADRLYSYSVTPFDGTSFQWSVGPGGVINGESNRNSVQVSFYSFSSNPFVAVLIEDCTRGCQQVDTLFLNLSQPYQITGSAFLCPGETGSWKAGSGANPVPSTWEIYDEGGVLVHSENSPTSILNFSPDESGMFSVVGYPEAGNFCDPHSSLNFWIHQPVVVEPEIEGPEVICPGQYYSYNAVVSDGQGIYLEWVVYNGADTLFYTGEEIRIQWGNEMLRRIEVRAVDILTACTGEFTVMEVVEYETLEWTGRQLVCVFSEEVYTVDSIFEDGLEWTLSDPDMGVIIDYPDHQSVRVKWFGTGEAELEVEFCGLQYSNTITVLGDPAPEIATESTVVCLNGTTSASTTEEYETYSWFRDEALVCQDSVCDLGRGRYLLVVEDSLGCSGRVRFEIGDLDLPGVSIKNIDPAGMCDGDSVRIVANVFNLPGYTFTWYFNGMPLPNDSDTLVAYQFGEYYLEAVHDATGCKVESSELVICEHCDPGTLWYYCLVPGEGPPLPPDYPPTPCDPIDGSPEGAFSIINSCTEFEFYTNNPDLIEESIFWIIRDGATRNYYIGSPVDHTFSNPGTQRISVFGSIINALGDTVSLCPHIFDVVVPATIDFGFSFACEGDEMFFNPISKLGGGGIGISDYSWDFGDPLSGANNQSSLSFPSHIFSSSGLFNVKLTVTTTLGCEVEKEKQVRVRPLPDADFSLDDPYCTYEPVEPMAVFDNGFHDWYFDSGNSPDALHDKHNPGLHRYDEGGNYAVKLRVEDLLGCVNENTVNVVIFEFDGDLDISSDKNFPLCEGDWVTLSTEGGYPNYGWSNGGDEPSVLAEISGPYLVTVTDDNGCVETAGPFEVNYEPEPQAEIAGRVIGESGLVRGDTLVACYGSSIALLAVGPAENREFLWSNGASAKEVVFDDEEWDILTVGLHEFTVEVENTLTGCRGISLPFFVRIHPTPVKPQLLTDPSGPLCSGEEIRIYVSNVAGDVNYSWAHGPSGTEIITEMAGSYRVFAENEFGCTALSDPVVINPLPDVSFAPRGCFEACSDAVICLPLPTGYEWVSWEKDGEQIGIPADPAAVLISENGSYVAELRNENGCLNRTDPINFEIFEEAGRIDGVVFLDVNEDSIFTINVDSLLSDVPVFLYENGVLVDSVTTDSDGEYNFSGVPEGTYEVKVRPMDFPPEWVLLWGTSEVNIDRCGDEATADPLIVIYCDPEETMIEIQGCDGEVFEVAGEFYERDTTFSIEDAGVNCLEITTYNIEFFPLSDTGKIQLTECTGEAVEWDGMQFISDTTLTYSYSDQNGCDSIEVIEITFDEVLMENRSFSLCPDETVFFEGHLLEKDTSFSFTSTAEGSACEVHYQVDVEVRGDWTASVLTQPACPDTEDGEAHITLDGVSHSDLDHFLLNGNQITATEVLNNLKAGHYELVMSDVYGCENELEFDIGSREELSVQVDDVVLDCEIPGDYLTVEIHSGDDGTLRVRWEDGSTGDALYVEKEGLYSVEVTNECQSVERLARAYYEDDDAGIAYYVPNAFSPNEDGINDRLMPLFPPDAVLSHYYFAVFDRWGNRVFMATEPGIGWDGIFREEPTDQAVFAWRLEVEIIYCGERTVIRDYGDVTVLR